MGLTSWDSLASAGRFMYSIDNLQNMESSCTPLRLFAAAEMDSGVA